MRVLIVDDSAVMRRALSRILDGDPDFEVLDTARDGRDALEKVQRLKPDLVTLDIEMPNMDGLTALRGIMREAPDPKPAVLMCSSLTSEGSVEAIKAMRFGASDVICKDPTQLSTNTDGAIAAELRAKLKAIGEQRARRIGRPAAGKPTKLNTYEISPKSIDLISIGSSTGGPPILEKVITPIAASLPVPIVVAQHMPATFTKSLANRLDDACELTVVHADAGMPLLPGTVYIIEGGRHGRVDRAGSGRLLIEIGDEPRSALYKPSVNELFDSSAKAAGKRCLGVVLTGMGDDGKIGAEALTAAGGKILTQEEHSCVVYGMPRAIDKAGMSAASLAPHEIGASLAHLAGTGSAGRSAA